MPEGDTIFRTAARLRPVLEGRCIDAADCRVPQLGADALAGRVIAAVEARGKHLLIHLDDGRVIHSHLGMHGAWHIYRLGQPWQKPARQAALCLRVPETECVCFNPKTLELLSETAFRRHPHLHRLGPDLLADKLDEAEVLRRFRTGPLRPIGEAVMDQTIVCGIGNVYKSEVLFLCRIDPFVAVGQLGDDRLVELIQCARQLMSKNLRGDPRRTRFRLDGERVWVYGRAGKACFTCGAPVQIRRQGDLGRTTFWCPACQGCQRPSHRIS
jgi:endonuclease VIII